MSPKLQHNSYSSKQYTHTIVTPTYSSKTVKVVWNFKSCKKLKKCHKKIESCRKYKKMWFFSCIITELRLVKHLNNYNNLSLTTASLDLTTMLKISGWLDNALALPPEGCVFKSYQEWFSTPFSQECGGGMANLHGTQNDRISTIGILGIFSVVVTPWRSRKALGRAGLAIKTVPLGLVYIWRSWMPSRWLFIFNGFMLPIDYLVDSCCL